MARFTLRDAKKLAKEQLLYMRKVKRESKKYSEKFVGEYGYLQSLRMNKLANFVLKLPDEGINENEK